MKSIRHVSIVLLLIFVLVPLYSEGAREQVPETAETPFAVIVDSYGYTVEIEKRPESIVSLGPNITETLYALGVGDSLIGRTEYCDYPEEVLTVETVGDIMNPSIEKIIDLEPDLVLSSTHVGKEIVESLKDAGITIVCLYSDESFEGVYTTIRDIALLTGTQQQAEQIIHEMKETLDYVQQTVEGAPRPKVYYVIDFGQWGDFTAGGDTFIHQLIELAGGKNIAEDVNGWSISLEKIMEEDPDLLICSDAHDSKSRLAEAHGYKDLRAVQNGEIYTFNNDQIDRQGVRLAEGVLDLAKILHPDRF